MDKRSARRIHRQQHSLPGAHRGRDGAPLRPAGRRSPAPNSIVLPESSWRPVPNAPAPAPGRQDPHRLERPDDFGLRQGRSGARRAALRRGCAARRGFRHRPHVRRRERYPAAALSRGRCRHSGLSRRLRPVRAGAARSLRSAVRPAPSGTGRAAHRKAAGAVRGHRARRLLQLRPRTTTGWCCASRKITTAPSLRATPWR